VSGGRDLVYKDMEGVCTEDFVLGRSTRCHVPSVTYIMYVVYAGGVSGFGGEGGWYAAFYLLLVGGGV